MATSIAQQDDTFKHLSKLMSSTAKLEHYAFGNLFELADDNTTWTDLNTSGYLCLVINYDPLQKAITFYTQDNYNCIFTIPLSSNMEYTPIDSYFHSFNQYNNDYIVHTYAIYYRDDMVQKGMALATQLYKMIPHNTQTTTSHSNDNSSNNVNASKPTHRVSPSKDSSKGLLGRLFGSSKDKDKNNDHKKMEIGLPTNFKHVGSGIACLTQGNGFDIDSFTPEQKDLFKRAGIRKADLKDPATAKMVLNTVLDVIKQDQTKEATSNNHNNDNNQQSTAAVIQQRAPPPPPKPKSVVQPPPRPARQSATNNTNIQHQQQQISNNLPSPHQSTDNQQDHEIHSPISPPIPARRQSTTSDSNTQPQQQQQLQSPAQPQHTPRNTQSIAAPTTPHKLSHAPVTPTKTAPAPPAFTAAQSTTNISPNNTLKPNNAPPPPPSFNIPSVTQQLANTSLQTPAKSKPSPPQPPQFMPTQTQPQTQTHTTQQNNNVAASTSSVSPPLAPPLAPPMSIPQPPTSPVSTNNNVPTAPPTPVSGSVPVAPSIDIVPIVSSNAPPPPPAPSAITPITQSTAASVAPSLPFSAADLQAAKLKSTKQQQSNDSNTSSTSHHAAEPDHLALIRQGVKLRKVEPKKEVEELPDVSTMSENQQNTIVALLQQKFKNLRAAEDDDDDNDSDWD